MAQKQAYDAGHFSFLELIKALVGIAGPDFTKGALIRTAIGAAKQQETIEFESLKDFVASIDLIDNPIAQFEGQAVHYGDAVFGLPKCPFAGSIKTYTDVSGGLPSEYKAITDKINKPSAASDRFQIGEGAAVSPFCGVHQPIRSALGQRVKIGGLPLVIFQLGCKSGSGATGLAARWIEAAGVDPALVEKILVDNMCCYCIRFAKE